MPDLFTAQHITRKTVLQLAAPRDRVFPLFTPLGEKHWAAGWEPRIYHPQDGTPEVGAVFVTTRSGEAETTWVITELDSAQARISYVRVTPDSHVAAIGIHCAEGPAGASTVSVTYTLTALGAAGNAYLGELTDAKYQEWIGSWGTAINHYLLHGQLLAHH
ncbi:MAG TPA: SRPBCC family protein [Chloroflexia bacterium]|nr:SRPBCC family protein [Chloroflexia bacterium]